MFTLYLFVFLGNFLLQLQFASLRSRKLNLGVLQVLSERLAPLLDRLLNQPPVGSCLFSSLRHDLTFLVDHFVTLQPTWSELR